MVVVAFYVPRRMQHFGGTLDRFLVFGNVGCVGEKPALNAGRYKNVSHVHIWIAHHGAHQRPVALEIEVAHGNVLNAPGRLGVSCLWLSG